MWPLVLAALATLAFAWALGIHPARVLRAAAWSLPMPLAYALAAAVQHPHWRAWASQPVTDWRHASLLLIHGHPLPAVLITVPLAVPGGLAIGAALWAWCCHAYGHGLAGSTAWPRPRSTPASGAVQREPPAAPPVPPAWPPWSPGAASRSGR